MFKGVDEIRDAYRKDSVAQAYIAERFVEPLGALLHDRQVALLRQTLAERQPHRVLEIAPGPARLTASVSDVIRGKGLIMDASAQMLKEATRRLGEGSPWTAVQGDAFRLPFRASFDMVYSFRLLRHFESAERSRMYAQIHAALKRHGLFMFDAVNEAVSRRLREDAPDEYQHFDAMFLRAALEDEIQANGFTPMKIVGVQHRFPTLRQIQVLVGPRSRGLARAAMEVCDRMPLGEPLEWIVICQKR